MALNPPTPEQLRALLAASPADVLSVYTGKAGKCCCGCAGLHRYSSANRRAAERGRGYAITDDEINDRQVARVLGLLRVNAERVLVDSSGHFCSLELAGRLVVAYFKKEN